MKDKKYKILIFSGTRAEYGILRPLIKTLSKETKFEISLLITGTHLSTEFGYTINEIIDDKWKFKIYKVETILGGDTPVSVCKSMGLGLISFSEKFSEIKPDLFLCLGDRFETLAAVTAAATSNIAIAHLQGGEVTKGAVDDLYRHAISKLSTVHYVATEIYRKRVVQLGENPDMVINVGALNVEAMKLQKSALKNDFLRNFNIPKKKLVALVTLHPSTLEPNNANIHANSLIKAMKKRSNIFYIITKTIADAEGRVINKLWEKEFSNKPNIYLTSSLGHYWYKAALKYCDFCIGNSSSGIIETPQFKIPTINLGNREAGRIQANNVINSSFNVNDIIKSIDHASSTKFKRTLSNIKDPYYKSHTSKLITKHLIKNLSKIKPGKDFYDIL